MDLTRVNPFLSGTPFGSISPLSPKVDDRIGKKGEDCKEETVKERYVEIYVYVSIHYGSLPSITLKNHNH